MWALSEFCVAPPAKRGLLKGRKFKNIVSKNIFRGSAVWRILHGGCQSFVWSAAPGSRCRGKNRNRGRKPSRKTRPTLPCTHTPEEASTQDRYLLCSCLRVRWVRDCIGKHVVEWHTEVHAPTDTHPHERCNSPRTARRRILLAASYTSIYSRLWFGRRCMHRQICSEHEM